MGVAAGLADAVGDRLAGVRLAAGDHDLGAELCQQLRGGAADAAARAGDDGYSAGEIERGGLHGCSFVIPGRASSAANPESRGRCMRFRVRAIGPRFARTADAPRNDENYTSPPLALTRRRW